MGSSGLVIEQLTSVVEPGGRAPTPRTNPGGAGSGVLCGNEVQDVELATRVTELGGLRRARRG